MLRYLLLLLIFAFAKKLVGQQQLIDITINKETIKEYVTALAHDNMRGRYSGTKQNRKAGVFISNQMKRIGLLKINGNNFEIPVSENNTNYGNNIVAAIKGLDSLKKDTVIIFSAHYDHIGGSFNGANDNASGVAALLSLAKYYMHIQNAYTLLFIAFTGEEQGMVGSKHLLKNINSRLIKLNINLEMLGRKVGDSINPYLVTAKGKKYLSILNENLNSIDLNFGINFFKKDIYPEQILASRSDHYSFNKLGIDAFTIMLSSPYDIHYHKITDETKTLDFDAMTIVVKAIALATTPLVE